MVEQHPFVGQLGCAELEHPALRLALAAQVLECNGILLFIERGGEHGQALLDRVAAFLLQLEQQGQRLEALGVEDGEGAVFYNQHPVIEHEAGLALLEEAHVEDVVRVRPFLVEDVLHQHFPIEVLPIIHY